MLSKRERDIVKVLIIESDEYNIRIMDSFLYACGYTNVVLARSGREALERFTFDTGLVFVNVHLSDLTGIEICKRLRATPRGRTVPIVAIVPQGKGIKTKCFKSGITDVMATPTSFKGFESILQKNLRLN